MLFKSPTSESGSFGLQMKPMIFVFNEQEMRLNSVTVHFLTLCRALSEPSTQMCGPHKVHLPHVGCCSLTGGGHVPGSCSPHHPGWDKRDKKSLLAHFVFFNTVTLDQLLVYVVYIKMMGAISNRGLFMKTRPKTSNKVFIFPVS